MLFKAAKFRLAGALARRELSLCNQCFSLKLFYSRMYKGSVLQCFQEIYVGGFLPFSAGMYYGDRDQGSKKMQKA